MLDEKEFFATDGNQNKKPEGKQDVSSTNVENKIGVKTDSSSLNDENIAKEKMGAISFEDNITKEMPISAVDGKKVNEKESSSPKGEGKVGDKSAEPEKEAERSLDGGEGEKKKEGSEVKPYKVFGTDISIIEPDYIDYYKTRMKVLAIRYKLVGRVDERGRYVITDDVRRDLVNMEKEIEEIGEDYYKAIALYMRKHFYYHVKISAVEGGKAKGSLFISEFVDDFLGEEYIVTHVADFVDTYDDDFRIKLRKAFHLVDVEVKTDDLKVPNLAVVMQDAFDLELIVGGLYDMASQIYLMRMIKLLEESGEMGKKVLARYRGLLIDKDIEVNEKFRYTRYKALLDRAIDEFGGLEKLGINKEKCQEIIKDINSVVRAIDNASGKSGALEADMPNKPKEEKKGGAVKKSTPNKGPTKSNGGGGSSDKKAPKKEAKKEKKEEPTKSGGVTTADLYKNNEDKNKNEGKDKENRPDRHDDDRRRDNRHRHRGAGHRHRGDEDDLALDPNSHPQRRERSHENTNENDDEDELMDFEAEEKSRGDEDFENASTHAAEDRNKVDGEEKVEQNREEKIDNIEVDNKREEEVNRNADARQWENEHDEYEL